MIVTGAFEKYNIVVARDNNRKRQPIATILNIILSKFISLWYNFYIVYKYNVFIIPDPNNGVDSIYMKAGLTKSFGFS